MSHLDGKQDDFSIAAVLTAAGRPAREVAEICGVSRRTVERWRDRPAFRRLVDKTRLALLDVAVGNLIDAAGDAVSTLRRNLNCGNPSAEIQAAKSILAEMIRFNEQVDVLPRLGEIERQCDEVRKANR